MPAPLGTPPEGVSACAVEIFADGVNSCSRGERATFGTFLLIGVCQCDTGDDSPPERGQSADDMDHAIWQIISRAVSSDEVVDSFAAAAGAQSKIENQNFLPRPLLLRINPG